MKISVKYKHAYDEDGNIIDISSVNIDNRLPVYYSIGSHTPMVAALGEKNQHHFRSKKGYQINPETELHKYSKKILKHRFETQDTFVIGFFKKSHLCSSCIFKCKYSELTDVNGIQLFDLKDWYDTASIEKAYDGFIADVLLTSSSHPNRKPVFLEVCVSHKCDENKINSNNKIIEIDIKEENDAYSDLIMSQFEEENKIHFYNFINDYRCEHFSDKKNDSQQHIVTETLPSGYTIKYYCIPQEVKTMNPIENYEMQLKIGMHFARHEYGDSYVFSKAISLDKKRLVVLGKDLKTRATPWVVYIISYYNAKYMHSFLLGFYNIKEALSAYKEAIEKAEETS